VQFARVVVQLLACRAESEYRALLLGEGRARGLDTPGRVLTEANLHAVYGLEACVLDHPEQPGQPWVLFRAGA